MSDKNQKHVVFWRKFVWDQKESWQCRYEEAKEEGQADVCVRGGEKKGKERQRSLKNRTRGAPLGFANAVINLSAKGRLWNVPLCFDKQPN